MRPSVMLLGFLLGSSAATTFGLLGVAFIYWVIGPDNPDLRAEAGLLLTHLARFSALTAVSAVSFYGLLRQRPWRRYSVAMLLAVLGAVVVAYASEAGWLS